MEELLVQQTRPQRHLQPSYKHKENVTSSKHRHELDQQSTLSPMRNFNSMKNNYSHKHLDQYKNPFLQRPRTTTPRMYSGYQPFSFSTNSVSSNEQEYILDEIDDVNDFVPVCAYSNNYGHSIISSNAPNTMKNVTTDEFVLDEPYLTLQDEYDLVPQSDGSNDNCKKLTPSINESAERIEGGNNSSASTSPPPLSSIDNILENTMMDDKKTLDAFCVDYDLKLGGDDEVWGLSNK